MSKVVETPADTIRVVVIPADDEQPATVQEMPREDGSVLRALQAAVDGLVDAVGLAEGVDMWVNDEGLFTKSRNARATHVLHAVKVAQTTGEYPAPEGADPRDVMEHAILTQMHVVLFGTAVIAGHDEEGGTVSVPERLLAFLRDQVGLIE